MYQYFSTSLGSWSTRIYELTRRLLKLTFRSDIIHVGGPNFVSLLTLLIAPFFNKKSGGLNLPITGTTHKARCLGVFKNGYY